MIEIWKDIEGYEGDYQVSNLGRVKSFKYKSERILKPCVDKDGYRDVRLCKHNKPKHFKIHRLVAEAFIPNPENKPQVNHIDEDKVNNMVSNLEWVTPKENNNHGTRTERMMISQGTKIKAIDITSGECNEYPSMGECARRLGLSQGNISNCLHGKLRQTGGYVFQYKEVN
ncbi:HNH endonuclease family protein [Enterococcus phage vB_EfaS_785CS]|uniref:HNH endonuclease family protein n=1 Tax=Enterococcus phage vB_EfaS_785CS TaxID=2836121 RepID=A0A8E6YH12_9CAUD|nr:HNH endonuclease family protein [Enterococcus phage vB_EfaS_785CC]QVU02110.1 HNH endonuclease family protein [Enterococcus phage vB_EfaS_785CS]WAX15139.1 DNA endonuclease [Enterococcus phage EF326P1]WCS66474.1 HNH endonuclease family protein [Enterococcus phage DEfc27b]